MKLVLRIILFLSPLSLFSQHDDHEVHEEDVHPHEDNIEVYLGNTYNLGYETNFATFGLDYEYRFKHFNYRFGLSLLADYEFANVHHEESQEKKKHSEFLITPVLNFYPTEKFKVFGGGGFLFQKNHNQLVSRLGVGYEIEIHHRFLIIPSVSTDLGKDYTAFLAGVALGIGFF